jgi:hypothetical protein
MTNQNALTSILKTQLCACRRWVHHLIVAALCCRAQAAHRYLTTHCLVVCFVCAVGVVTRCVMRKGKAGRPFGGGCDPQVSWLRFLVSKSVT